MPLRSLTPLGRQLRSVLASIRTPCPNANTSRPRIAHTYPCHEFEARRNASAGTSVVVQDAPTVHETQQEAHDAERKVSVRRSRRRTRVNRITEALRTSAKHIAIIPDIPEEKIDHSHYNVQRRGARAQHAKNALRHKDDFIPTLTTTRELSLQNILASYIQHRSATHNTELSESKAPLRLRRVEAALLKAKGFDLDDVAAWATVITSQNSLVAAQTLADRISSDGISSVPLFVLLYHLRRPYISAPALRIITNQAWLILEEYPSQSRPWKTPVNQVFLVFVRLIRHAREVWPAGLESITAILLQFLPKAIFSGNEVTTAQLETLTFSLNKAMRLIALRLAIQPFKNNRFQQLALVRILGFMAEHNPPIQTTREGYRAVVSVQLTQSKTKKERLWAELKGLSWPPWKQERTAMDFETTADDHGISKARETLIRMQEAGYAPLEWEKVATIYTGWDTDGTPTIQTRVLFEASPSSLRSGTAAWTARINTTRTAQEAWACYLAYEDSKIPSDPNVYLALFQKLFKEEERERQTLRLDQKGSAKNSRQRLPGDQREVEPLPPSAHLYTYTRTPPPTLDEFYWTLRERGVVFTGHCLAFLVANARSLEAGLGYLRDSAYIYPEHASVLDRHPPTRESIDSLPMPIFAAIVQLLSRFPNHPFLLDSPPTPQGPAQAMSSPFLDRYGLKANSAIVRAIELLSRRRPVYRPAWNSIFTALTHDSSIRGLYSSPNSSLSAHQEGGVEDEFRGTIVAYRITRKMLSLMRHSNLDLDANGFRALCHMTEKLAVACWKALKNHPIPGSAKAAQTLVDAGNTMRSPTRTKHLNLAFRELSGSDRIIKLQSEVQDVELHDTSQVPSALEILSAAILHAYVRALGWMGDHDGVLDTVRWMVKYKVQLAENFVVDQNGEIMMRRLLCAVRVFLERRWISSPSVADSGDEPGQQLADTSDGILERRRQPADADLIEEARALIDSVEEWGGWPDDEEVDEHCKHQRFYDTR